MLNAMRPRENQGFSRENGKNCAAYRDWPLQTIADERNFPAVFRPHESGAARLFARTGISGRTSVHQTI